MKANRIFSLLVCVAIAALFFIVPEPVSLEANSWHFLGLFIAVILAVILQVMPLGAVCLIAIAIVAITGITTPAKDIRASHIKVLNGIIASDSELKIKADEAVNDALIAAFSAAIVGGGG